MMLTNIADFLAGPDGELEDKYFHIADIEYYEELGMPFYYDAETGIVMDSSGEPAILTLHLLDSINWDIVDE